MQGIITLTTDLGNKDYYVAAVKAAILRELSDTSIVDVSNEIPAFHIGRGAFNLKNVYNLFPEGTCHIFGVCPENSEETPHVVGVYKNQYFIGADNGFLSLMFDEGPEEIYKIRPSLPDAGKTFPTKDVFAKVACNIIKGKPLNEIGQLTTDFKRLIDLIPTHDDNTIKGAAIYFDNYGNITTNITKDLFDKIANNRQFEIVFRGVDYEIPKIHQNYSQVPEGEKVALFNHNGYLEIAINNGNAKKLFGVKDKDMIRIEFKSAKFENTLL
jgi:hypothetical protein